MPDHTYVEGYKIEFNTSKETIITNETQFAQEVAYKSVLSYTVSAFNCYGNSVEITNEIYISKKLIFTSVLIL